LAAWFIGLAFGLIALLGIGLYIANQSRAVQEIAAFSVKTDQAGASILLDGRPPQIAPNTFTHVSLGAHEISVTLENYEPIKQEIEVRAGMSPEVHLHLKPIQEVATLAIKTEPPGASILLDGKMPQVAPNTFTHLPFGSHQLSATLENYEPIKQEIQIGPGSPPEIRLQFKPIQEIAALSVKVEQPGASILLDGKPPQVPPNTFTRVPLGTHQLSVTLENYEPIKQEIEVRAGMSPEIRLQLKPLQEIATLSVQTEPSGASILLDGKPPQSPPNTFTHVPFGQHQITAVLENYEPVRQDIQVRRGMSSEVRLPLKQISEIAALKVQADPASAVILLDGKPPQEPPNTFTHVPLGPHQLSATLDNYESIMQDIDVRAGMPTEIRLQLKSSQETGRETFQVFLRDAQLGDSTAMMKLGRLYLKKGTPSDDAEGFQWLNRAYNAPNRNLEAGAYVGDCYLSGRGTKQDIQKAEDIILPLANQNVVPAMTLAGRILEYKSELKRGAAAGTANPKIQKQLEAQANDFEEQARHWWERAEKDDWNASAHLGKCYEEGWGGVEKSEEEAAKRYQGGVDHGNALSMLFYGLMIQNKPGRRSEAEALVSRAATAGIPSAVKWCRDNNVSFGEKKPNDDRP
jgi:TPR repeat protein/chaperone required for assembly of F1-ATPase